MLPCYKGHKNSSERTQRDLKQQKHNNTPWIFWRVWRKGLEEEEEEPGKYNPSKEWNKYEIWQNTIVMEITNKKSKKCINKCKTKIVKLMCL
jgi:hypothetical protein